MLEQIMLYCRNFFYRSKEADNFNIANGNIIIKGKYYKGQYIRIINSLFNDGVYKISEVTNNTIIIEDLVDETFQGYIMGLAVPKQFIELVTEIEEYTVKNKPTGIISENLGNYSYSKGTTAGGKVVSWEDVFLNRLSPYRKLNDGFNRVKFIDKGVL